MVNEKLKTKKALSLFWIIALGFLTLNAIALYRQNYWFSLSPLILGFIYLYLFRLELIFDLLVLLTPLSVQLSDFFPQLGLDLFLPTEPMALSFMLLIWFKLALGMKIDKSFLKHPLSILVLLYLLWLFITSITSSIPIVSFKYLLVKLWYISILFFYLPIRIKSYKNMRHFLWLYIIPFAFVVLYTLYNLSFYGFSNFKAAHFVMSPFFRDHTIYGASLAFYIPSLLALFTKSQSKSTHILLLFLFLILTLGLIYSYTRAAWVGLFLSFIVFIILKFKIKLRTLLIGFFALVLIGFQFWWAIYFQLKDNKQDSSANFTKHIESISNIATDASNLERINRWKSALRLFEVKPLTGWGPGTYQFQYAKYQFSYDKTIISTDFGDGGNAHSEYLGLLSETGLPGMLLFIALLSVSVVVGIRIYKKHPDREARIIALSLLLGLITYYFHAFLNNYLDTDKASVPFWGFLAILVVLDNSQKK